MLAIIRGIHTAIYLVMASSTLALVYAGATGASGWWLGTALTLLAFETVELIPSRWVSRRQHWRVKGVHVRIARAALYAALPLSLAALAAISIAYSADREYRVEVAVIS